MEMWWFLSETNGAGRLHGTSNKGQASDGQTAGEWFADGVAIEGFAVPRDVGKGKQIPIRNGHQAQLGRED